MSTLLLAAGILVAVFVGFNIGGSNTGVAFGPAVGSGAVSKLAAGGLMTVFALLGGWTVGRRVVDTLGSDIVTGDPFTLSVSIAMLFFVGLALFASNVFGVPASTSMTAVGAIAGFGLASNRLNTGVVLEIVSWWFVAPIVGFWVSAVVGRYAYDEIAARIAVRQSEGPLLEFAPRPKLGPNTTMRELGGTALVVAIACYMAFSAGASNVANAVAPLVGNGSLTMNQGILLAAGSIGLGAFTIARRTLDTVGNDLTDLPLAAALVVATVSASLVTVLSGLGIPASFVVIATMSIVGLGWGRATRAEGTTLPGTPPTGVGTPGATRSTEASAQSAAAATGFGTAGELTEEPPLAPTETAATAELYRPATTARIVLLQNLVPALATAAAYIVFRFVPFV
ncbi:inorganic phosphate transporter [Haloprofundus sp. MHR1]|uniref:inorganic phosphate transporter n=1 Tax=Haloprofundus sp. MHR1 TaxID=2572921 RepID=UPI0010BEF793|nr:inorganic phosphate transporter [Haloprofundus sp. MHR1]QCJ46762.1 inorganic phosphate transporter [Haloprofundus sp. MHR1]